MSLCRGTCLAGMIALFVACGGHVEQPEPRHRPDVDDSGAPPFVEPSGGRVDSGPGYPAHPVPPDEQCTGFPYCTKSYVDGTGPGYGQTRQ